MKRNKILKLKRNNKMMLRKLIEAIQKNHNYKLINKQK